MTLHTSQRPKACVFTVTFRVNVFEPMIMRIGPSSLARVYCTISHHAAESMAHFAGRLIDHEPRWRISRAAVNSNNAQATVINDFLPPDIADEWHSALNKSWQLSLPCRERGECSRDACSWLFATNSRGGNAKVRSVYQVAERRKFVQEAHRHGLFSYSKWELGASHPLYAAVGKMMEHGSVRAAVARATGLVASPAARLAAETALGNVSDYFITAFDHSDFLSTHSDGASGSLAWVLSLSRTWDEASGGALRFDGVRHGNNRDMVPVFNRMVFFLTRPSFTPHQVLPVSRAPGAEPRFGLTGWYMTRGDRFSAAIQRENDAMKAAMSKASVQGDTCLR